VFFFTPHKKWYLIFQVLDKTRRPALQPAFSTTKTIELASSWSSPKLLFEKTPPGISRWIDFWVLRGASRVYLFFTSHDGRLFRSSTSVKDFPTGWTKPQTALVADIFEAAHIYKLKGLNRYLALVEAIGPRGRRYYKAFLAKSLQGRWTPIADSWKKAFASSLNVRFEKEAWTDSFSHGELIRAGYDERLSVNPFKLEFLFQGVSDRARDSLPYGKIPWRLGLLKQNF